VSAYQVLTGNPADTTSWMPGHRTTSGLLRASAGDGHGRSRFFLRQEPACVANISVVKKVALPGRGRLSVKRAKNQKERWFRRALRWRAGCEATISTLKHPFSMLRATSQNRPWISALRGLVC